MQHSISSSAQLSFRSIHVGSQSYRVCTASLPEPTTTASSSTEPKPPRPSTTTTTTAPPPPTAHFSDSIHWPHPAHYRHVIGPRGSTIAAIRAHCGPGIDICVPGPASSDPAIRIRGTSRNQVTQAKHQIQAILDSTHVRDSPYTHFLALPLPSPSQDPEVHARLARLQSSLMADAGPLPAGVRLAPIAATELHLTLLMLRLPTPDHVVRATHVLKSLAPQVYDAVRTQTMLVQLRGLRTFGDPARATLVYLGAQDREDKRVERLAQVLIDGFAMEGMVPKEEAKLPTLHLTLVRAKSDTSGKDPKGEDSSPSKGKRASSNARPVFDATKLLDKYRDTDIAAKLRIPSVQLLKREKVEGPEGSQYVLEAEIALP